MRRTILQLILIVIVLLKATSCSNNYLPGFDFDSFDETPAAELADAVEADDTEKIQEILKQNKSVVDYQEPKFGHSLLFLAVVNNKYNAARALLDNGARTDLKSFTDSSDVLMTICEGYNDNLCDTAMLNLLLRYKPNVNSHCYSSGRSKITILFKASERTFMCLSFIKTLVDNGADVNYWPENNPALSPIASAMLMSRLDIVHFYLIDCKANIPQYVTLRPGKDDIKTPITITQMLNEHDYSNDPKRQKLKLDILNYLKSIGKE